MDTIALDTNIAIDILNGNEEILHKYENYSLLHLPVTVCGELLYDAANSGNSKQNLTKYRGFMLVLSSFAVTKLFRTSYADRNKQ